MIKATGLGSGLDIDAIVAGLVNAEREPAEARISRLTRNIDEQVSAVGQLSSVLATFESSVKVLNDRDVVFQSTVTNSDWNAVAPTVTGTPSTGVYDIEVTSLASAQTLATTSTFSSVNDTVGTGTLTFNVGTPGYTGSTYSSFAAVTGKQMTLTVDSTNNTLTGLRDAINNLDAGISASIIKDGSAYRLLFSAAESGVDNSISVSTGADAAGGLTAFAFDDGSANLQETNRAADAAFSVNGLSLSSASNTVTDIVSGLDIKLKKDASSVKIEVVNDSAMLLTAVQSFVDAHNSAISTINSLTSYDASTGVAGALQGDSLPRSLQSVIRNVISASPSNTGQSITLLSDLGITYQEGGLLVLSETAFTEAITANSGAVASFFAGADASSLEDGFSGSLLKNLSGFTNVDGTIEGRLSSLDLQKNGFDDDRDRLDKRISELEARYVRQFNAMDALIARLTTTGDFLLAQLNSMPAANRDKK